MKNTRVVSILAVLGAAASAMAQTSIYVSQVGLDGAASALTATGTAVRIKQFNPFGSVVNQVDMPSLTGADGSTQTPLPGTSSTLALNVQGNVVDQAQLNLSSDRTRLVIAGANVDLGATWPGGTGPLTRRRTIGLVDLNLTSINTTTADSGPAANLHSAFDSTTNTFYNATSSVGVRRKAFGTNSGSDLLSSQGTATVAGVTPAVVTAWRSVNLFGGQIYATTNSTSSTALALGLNLIPSTPPASTGSGGPALGTGLHQRVIDTSLSSVTGSSSSPYDFVISSLSATAGLVYIADARATANGGLQIWTNTSGSSAANAWTFVTISVPNASGAAFAGLRALTQDPNNLSLFYSITTDNRLISIDISSLSNPIITTLATAPTNTAFRGVRAIPAPGGFGVLVLAGLAATRRRR